MNLRMLKICATGLAMIPLLGANCMEDKIVDLIITGSAETEFEATGQVNVYDETKTVNVKAELDLAGLLADNGIDPMDLSEDAVKLSKIYYKVVTPEAGRSIQNGVLELTRGAVTGILVSGFNADMGAVTDWIEITDLLGVNGVAMLNAFLRECVLELQGRGLPVDGTFTYHVSGTSNPQNDPSNFVWAVKIQFQGKVPKVFNLPNI